MDPLIFYHALDVRSTGINRKTERVAAIPLSELVRKEIPDEVVKVTSPCRRYF